MKWSWSDLWRRLWPGHDGAPQDDGRWGWGASTAQVIAVAVAVLLFGGLAVWIVYRVVAFFGAYGAMADRFSR